MMAEAYHNETLRKQRVIDRALEARKIIEDQKKKYADKSVQVGGHSSRRSNCKKHHARAERKAENVRRDLRKQELVLHDSNLVMGTITVDDP